MCCQWRSLRRILAWTTIVRTFCVLLNMYPQKARVSGTLYGGHLPCVEHLCRVSLPLQYLAEQLANMVVFVLMRRRGGPLDPRG